MKEDAERYRKHILDVESSRNRCEEIEEDYEQLVEEYNDLVTKYQRFKEDNDAQKEEIQALNMKLTE